MTTTNRSRKNILTLNGATGIHNQHHHHHHHHHQPQLAQPQHPLGHQQSHVEGLPKPFVAAMRTLFDIMDDGKTGFVKLAEIEDRWQDDGSKGLPRGVIDSLRKVTPSSGLLSFDRFCSGLKICLLRNQSETTTSSSTNRTSRLMASKDTEKLPLSPGKLSVRPPSAPLLDLDSLPSVKPSWATAANTATVRPNNAMPAQKTLSMPQLNPDNDLDLVLESPPIILPGSTFGPPKPPRVSLNLERAQPNTGTITSSNSASTNGSSSMDKAEIRNALQNWQMSLLMNEQDKASPRLTRGSADGQIDLGGSSPSSSMHLLYQKKPTSGGGRRREPRRHTLQNGIDYSMLKRLKQIEQEKDILLQGLTAVEKARDWYLKQLAVVQDKIKYLGRVGTHMEPWTDAHQERLDLQRARVLEVNRHLMTLAESWERGGFPMHMNLAIRPPVAMTYPHMQQQPQQRAQPQSQQSNAAGGQTEMVNRELLQLQRSKRAASMTSNTEELVF